MSSIPDFFDNYHLPDGEHECTHDDVEQLFVYNSQRQRVWGDYKRLIDRLESLGLKPKFVLIDGSFVTGREHPGDVDFGALFPPSIVKHAMTSLQDPTDKLAVQGFTDPNTQSTIRTWFGAHMLVAPNEWGMKQISKLFRTGGTQFGNLKDRDSKRDPDWVVIPKEKGILKINF